MNRFDRFGEIHRETMVVLRRMMNIYTQKFYMYGGEIKIMGAQFLVWRRSAALLIQRKE